MEVYVDDFIQLGQTMDPKQALDLILEQRKLTVLVMMHNKPFSIKSAIA
jgi:hypothetical protein